MYTDTTLEGNAVLTETARPQDESGLFSTIWKESMMIFWRDGHFFLPGS